jgi:AcrR family transcriptional regulator
VGDGTIDRTGDGSDDRRDADADGGGDRRYAARVSRAWRASPVREAVATTEPGPTPSRGRDRSRDVSSAILAAARACLLEDGYARLSTRRVAEAAGVPLSQIHYHFGSRQQLVLRILAAENERLLERQARLYAGPEALSMQWEQACEFLELDLASGYVRVLQELVAAGWSDPELANSLRELLGSWFRLLTDVARRTAERTGSLGPLSPEEAGTLMGLLFVGAEPMLLLGFAESELPARSALRKVGNLIRGFEAAGGDTERGPANT